MSRKIRGTYSQQVSIDVDGTEVLVDVRYFYTPGSPEQGPSYASGGQPAEPPDIEIENVTVNSLPVPDWFADIVYESETVHEQVLNRHQEPERE
jgi:hypothetical protein